MEDFYTEFEKLFETRAKQEEPLAKHVNFRIGGPAQYYIEVQNSKELMDTVRLAKKHDISWIVLGGGSNVLVSKKGVRGLVIQIAMRDWRRGGDRLITEAGVLTVFLARTSVKEGLSGLEWAIGLPGTIGGAVRGNAGCFGGEMKDVVESVRVYDVETGEERDMINAECKFGYRDSIFKHLDPSPIILSVTFKLSEGDSEKGEKKIKEYLEIRKDAQPLGASSAGCMFKNFEIEEDTDLSRLKQDTDIPESFLKNKLIPVGWLIDQAGLKGAKIGDAQVSDKHANFCLNLGKATTDQIMQLVSLIKSKVRDLYGLQLQEEVQFIGF